MRYHPGRAGLGRRGWERRGPEGPAEPARAHRLLPAGLTGILISGPEVVCGRDHDEPHEGGEEVEEASRILSDIISLGHQDRKSVV